MAAHVLSCCPMMATHTLTSQIVWTGTIKMGVRVLFRMHESESWGQVQQSVKEGEERMEGLRLGGGGGKKKGEVQS